MITISLFTAGLLLRRRRETFGGKNSLLLSRSRFGRVFVGGTIARVLRRGSSALFVRFGETLQKHRHAFHVQFSHLEKNFIQKKT